MNLILCFFPERKLLTITKTFKKFQYFLKNRPSRRTDLNLVPKVKVKVLIKSHQKLVSFICYSKSDLPELLPSGSHPFFEDDRLECFLKKSKN